MIKYRDYEIDETKDIFNQTPEEVFRYVNAQAMGKKRKKKFMELYDIFKQNGVTNIDISDDNRVKFTFNGDIDLSDKIGSEVAGYVVDYLDQGLRKKYTSQTKEKEEKEKNIPLYTNESFQNDIQEQIIRDYFKGRRDVNLNKEWDDVLDKRNEETGLYSTEGRAKVFSEQLRNYANSLKEDSYKFDETTPFKSLDEFKSALNSAADKLANNDLSGLNDIGFPQSKWFSDRGEDPFIDSEGNKYTAKDYYSAKYQQELKKQEEEVQTLQLKQAKIDQGNKGVLTLTSGVHGIDAKTQPQEYAQYLSKYGTGQQGFQRISQEIQNLLEKAYNGGGGNGLNASEKRQLGNFLYYIRSNNPKYKGLGKGKTNITQQEFEELKKSKYIGDLPMGNIIRLPWKTLDGRYTYADNRGNVYYLKPSNHQKYADISVDKDKMQAYNTYIKRVGKSEEQLNAQQRDKYLKSRKEGLTSAEVEELASIGLDIASIVDPEMFSAAGLALTGSGLRTHAMLQQPGGPSTSDWWWNAADWGLSILGSIPVLGDAALAARALNNLRKAVVPLGIVMAGANVPQAAKAAYNKVVNGQDLTIQDWRAIGAVLTTAVSMGKSRQISKRAQALQRVGGNSSTKTTKYKIKTSQGEINNLDESVVKDLKNKFKGTSKEVRTDAIRNHPKIQEAARKQGIDLSKAEVEGHSTFSRSPISSYSTSQPNNGSSTALSSAIRNYNQTHGRLSQWGLTEQDWIFRKTGGYETTPPTNYRESIKNLFKKSEWDDFGNNSTTSTQQSKSVSVEETPKINREKINELREKFGRNKPEQSNPKQEYNQKQQQKAEKEIELFLKSYGKGNNPSTSPFVGGYGSSKNKIKPGEYSFDLGNGHKVSFKITKEDISKKSVEELRHNIQKQFKDQVINKTDYTTIGNILKDLKKQGFLKQGGIIDKQRIQKYKEYIRK